MSNLDLDHFRTLLEEERERVSAAIQYLHEENPGSLEDDTGELVVGAPDQHPGDIATATFDRELDYTLEDNAEHVLGEIEAALQRIADGTYGTCSNCGKPISEERLEAIPYTTLCIDCRRKEGRSR
jgi:RNA polymerase-binding protein DksA